MVSLCTRKTAELLWVSSPEHSLLPSVGQAGCMSTLQGLKEGSRCWGGVCPAAPHTNPSQPSHFQPHSFSSCPQWPWTPNFRAFLSCAQGIDWLPIDSRGSTLSGLGELITHLLVIFHGVVAGPPPSPRLHAHILIYSFAIILVRGGEGAEMTMGVESLILNQEVYPYALESWISLKALQCGL